LQIPLEQHSLVPDESATQGPVQQSPSALHTSPSERQYIPYKQRFLPSAACPQVFEQHSSFEAHTCPPGRQLPTFLHVVSHTFEQHCASGLQLSPSTLHNPPVSLHWPPMHAVEQQSRAVVHAIPAGLQPPVPTCHCDLLGRWIRM
jgi:hypothetical protein